MPVAAGRLCPPAIPGGDEVDALEREQDVARPRPDGDGRPADLAAPSHAVQAGPDDPEARAAVGDLRGREPRQRGLEDHAGPGEPANADLLRAAVALVERLGRAPATPGETRRLLGVA